MYKRNVEFIRKCFATSINYHTIFRNSVYVICDLHVQPNRWKNNNFFQNRTNNYIIYENEQHLNIPCATTNSMSIYFLFSQSRFPHCVTLSLHFPTTNTHICGFACRYLIDHLTAPCSQNCPNIDLQINDLVVA